MRQPTARYQNLLMDSARWREVEFRDGDIVISTPPKCGTTWTQMICALLIFQSVDFPAPLDQMSLWPDMLTRRQDDILGALRRQRHRRFIKTHTPLDGLPFDERVTYLCVGRDPRDAAISWDHHTANADMDKVMAMRAEAVGPVPPGGDLPAAPESLRDRFWAWVDDDDVLIGLAPMLRHLSQFWAERHRANVVLLHYDDLRTDLPGQMRALAARLHIEVAEERWPELVRAATFDYMRGRARQYAPDLAIWRDPDRFFHRGSTGQWRDLLDADDLRRYQKRVAELAEADLAAWVHRGLTAD
ncbi:sulfotransferase domain-containing protein [Jidongwangia harbinensis]|uniref:sulfotransferase domain-containing protein n=1 Tax=Jidongwangia harbinensis TaxID=2878561 RepID=UPI001CD9CA99|nr:sulfotransferase domain-containing protein [Jidongwangia harbinensis]MCA2211807.1 sulfotransferase domain-containing protein [Jidongwangia harbinensis]